MTNNSSCSIKLFSAAEGVALILGLQVVQIFNPIHTGTSEVPDMQIRNSQIVPVWPHAFPLEGMTKNVTGFSDSEWSFSFRVQLTQALKIKDIRKMSATHLLKETISAIIHYWLNGYILSNQIYLILDCWELMRKRESLQQHM